MKCSSCQLESYRMTQVRWLGTRGLTIITSGNNNTTTRLERGPNPLSGVLIPRPWEVVILSLLSMSPSSPRLQRGPDPLSGILITTPPGDNHNNNKGLTHCYHGKKLIVTMITRLSGMGGPFCHKNWPCESMGQRGDLYGALHPLPSLFTSREKQL